MTLLSKEQMGLEFLNNIGFPLSEETFTEIVCFLLNTNFISIRNGGYEKAIQMMPYYFSSDNYLQFIRTIGPQLKQENLSSSNNTYLIAIVFAILKKMPSYMDGNDYSEVIMTLPVYDFSRDYNDDTMGDMLNLLYKLKPIRDVDPQIEKLFRNIITEPISTPEPESTKISGKFYGIIVCILAALILTIKLLLVYDMINLEIAEPLLIVSEVWFGITACCLLYYIISDLIDACSICYHLRTDSDDQHADDVIRTNLDVSQTIENSKEEGISSSFDSIYKDPADLPQEISHVVINQDVAQKPSS
jgi:hypothetical protein